MSSSRSCCIRPALHVAAALLPPCLLPLAALAQQLEPRAFSPNPVGINFVTVTAGRIEGDVLLDASSPIEDFEIAANEYAMGYGRTFALGDRIASFGVVVPAASADASGLVNGEPRAVTRNGLGDLKLRFSASLLPRSALSPAEFARTTPDRTLGLSLVVSAPTGEYLEEKLVNIGTNRWAFKPELGGSRQFGRWNIDGSVGVTVFASNPEFLGDSTRRQAPVGTVQGHVGYTFAPRLWLSASLTWYVGGQSEVDGVSNDDEQNNTRAGLTLSLPIGARQSIKVALSSGTSTRTGGDFDSVSVAWQYLWFD